MCLWCVYAWCVCGDNSHICYSLLLSADGSGIASGVEAKLMAVLSYLCDYFKRPDDNICRSVHVSI